MHKDIQDETLSDKRQFKVLSLCVVLERMVYILVPNLIPGEDMKILMGSRMEGAKKEDDFMFLYHLHILLWRGTPLFYKKVRGR